MQFFAFVMVAVSVAVAVTPTTIQTSLADRIMTLSRDSSWKRVASIPIALPHLSPARDGEDRRHALRLLRRDQGADQAVRRSRPTATIATPAKASAICSSST